MVLRGGPPTKPHLQSFWKRTARNGLPKTKMERSPSLLSANLSVASAALRVLCGEILSRPRLHQFVLLCSLQLTRIPSRKSFLSFLIIRTNAAFPVSSCAAAHSTISVSTGAKSIPFRVNT